MRFVEHFSLLHSLKNVSQGVFIKLLLVEVRKYERLYFLKPQTELLHFLKEGIYLLTRWTLVESGFHKFFIAFLEECVYFLTYLSLFCMCHSKPYPYEYLVKNLLLKLGRIGLYHRLYSRLLIIYLYYCRTIKRCRERFVILVHEGK